MKISEFRKLVKSKLQQVEGTELFRADLTEECNAVYDVSGSELSEMTEKIVQSVVDQPVNMRPFDLEVEED